MVRCAPRARREPCWYPDRNLLIRRATNVIASAAKQSRARAADSGLLRRLRLLAMTNRASVIADTSMLSSRSIARSPAVQKMMGLAAAVYLRLVWRTNRLFLEPANLYEWVEPHLPIIVAMWHGQHFMVPFLSRGHRVKVLISRHRDGEINAYAAQRLGIGTVRGSGDHGRR